MANTRKQLEQAYKLIEEEKLDKAIGILKPIVKKEPDNAEAWWMMANAVSEPEEAHNALENVLRLNPNHAQARELIETLRQEYPQLWQASGRSDFGDTDLSFDDLFQGGAPTPAASFDAAPASSAAFGDANVDDLFGSDEGFGSSSGFDAAPASSVSSASFDSGNIDDLFGNTPTDSGSFQSQSSEDLFSTPTFDDSGANQFASFDDQFPGGEPAFIQDDTFGMEAAAAKPQRGKAEAKPKKEKKPKEPKPGKQPQAGVERDPLEVEAQANRKFNPASLIIPLLLLVVLVGGGLFAGITTGIIKLGGGGQAPSQEMQTAITTIKGQLDNAGFQKATLGVVNDTPLGSAFMVQFCDTAGRQLQERINTALDMAATGAAAGRNEVKAAGIDVTSCADQNLRLFRAYVPLDKAVAYVDGGLKEKRVFRANLLRN